MKFHWVFVCEFFAWFCCIHLLLLQSFIFRTFSPMLANISTNFRIFPHLRDECVCVYVFMGYVFFICVSVKWSKARYFNRSFCFCYLHFCCCFYYYNIDELLLFSGIVSKQSGWNAKISPLHITARVLFYPLEFATIEDYQTIQWVAKLGIIDKLFTKPQHATNKNEASQWLRYFSDKFEFRWYGAVTC